jgi:hypothetical protein
MCLLFTTSAFCTPSTTYAQGTQLWFDYQVDYPFSNQYLLEGIVSYQTLLGGNQKWRNIALTPTFEWSTFYRIDLIVESPIV